MTKPAVPPPVRDDVVEIDAMDVAEWESGQRTPQASDANLAELVRKTAAPPEPAAHAPIVARERSRTQIAPSVVPRPHSRARTASPGPVRAPAQPRTTDGGPPAPPARTTRMPDPPAGPVVEPRPSPAPASSGIDFSLPVTATGESDARLPEPGPLPPTQATSSFAEPSRVGPGHNASPASSADPNTAWPPRPIPVAARLQLAPRVVPDAAILPPGREHAGGADRLKVALTRRRLWWIGGGLAAVSLAAVIAAVRLPSPEALPPEASEGGRPPPVAQPPAPRIDRGEPAASQDPARPARAPAAPDTGAAAAPAAVEAVDRRPTRSTSGLDTSMRIRSTESPAPRARHAGKKPAARKLVVDYTARPSEVPPPSLVANSEEDPAVGMARSAYTTGNQRLFVGDLDGAVHAYRQSLELYPGYVGGYRGLGLAYEELGETASALAALRSYVAAVPHARDIALIKRRIAHLQRR
jgi:hypothetical protein